MRFFIQTFGCRVNVAESDKLSLELQNWGLKLVSLVEAQIVIVNSCAVTAKAVREVRQFLNQTKAKNPQCKTVVTGCAATLWQKNKEKLDSVDLILENVDKEFMAEYLKKKFHLKREKTGSSSQELGKFLGSTRLMVKIQDGCDYFCTYCIVPYLRGRSHFADTNEIIKYIQTIQAKTAVNEVVLTGINLGLYPDLPKLARKVLKQTGIPKLSFGSLYVENLNKDFFKLYRQNLASRLTKYLHIPLQSGNQKQLSLMRRRYRLEEFTQVINDLQKAVPDALIATDIIVGFLEEDEDDFNQTYRYLEKSPISAAHIFKFSKREYTAAYFLAKKMKEPTALQKHQRSLQLQALFRKKLALFQDRLVGSTRRALIINNTSGVLLGFLDTGLRVVVPTTRKLVNSFIDVKIVRNSPNGLVARLAA